MDIVEEGSCLGFFGGWEEGVGRQMEKKKRMNEEDDEQ